MSWRRTECPRLRGGDDGDLTRSVADLHLVDASTAETRNRVTRAHADATRALVRLLEGRPRLALQAVDAAWPVVHETRDIVYTALLLTLTAWAHALQGRAAAAAAAVARARAGVDAVGDAAFSRSLDSIEGLVAFLRGEPGRALSLLSGPVWILELPPLRAGALSDTGPVPARPA